MGTHNPLAVRVGGKLRKTSRLVHPKRSLPGGQIECFAKVRKGDKVSIMKGGPKNLEEMRTEIIKMCEEMIKKLEGALPIAAIVNICGGVSSNFYVGKTFREQEQRLQHEVQMALEPLKCQKYCFFSFG